MNTPPIGQPGAFLIHGTPKTFPDLAQILTDHGFTPATAIPDLIIFATPHPDLAVTAEALASTQAKLAILLIPPLTDPADWRTASTIAATQAFTRACALAYAARNLRINAITCPLHTPATELAQTIALMLSLPSMTGQLITLSPKAHVS